MTSRCFVSVDLPSATKDYLGTLVRRDIYWIKWLKPRNFHITLNFLGDLNRERVEEARHVLTEIAGAHAPFAVRLDRIVPSRDMLWLMPGKNDLLEKLQDDLKERLKSARLGKRERRSYQPHVLLARSKTGRNMRSVIENFQPHEFVADQINLYESELAPGSAVHRLIESFKLSS